MRFILFIHYDLTRTFYSDIVPPQVSILVPTPLRVIYGDEVEIPVEVSGIPTPTIVWDTPGGEVC